MKKADMAAVESLLRANEDNYVSACAKFISRGVIKSPVWVLKRKDGNICALVLNSRSTLMPVLCGADNIPMPDFLNSFLSFNKIHSVQGLTKEVSVLETAMEKKRMPVSDVYDYNLMSLKSGQLIVNNRLYAKNKDLVFKVPNLNDLDALAPLQAAYEKEEVLPKGSVFSYAASRMNTANIITGKRILCAELDGRLIGKININAVSYTRFQVGGVYVHPDFRNMGIGQRMAAAFIESFINECTGVTLFVKKSNIAACRLYAGLGFTVSGDYRITYY